jgi:V/A-type H+-transporting ATPase subunit E
MAGADKIRDKILEEARQQAQTNIQRAEEEAARIISAAKEEADRRKNAIIEGAEKEAIERSKRLVSAAELEGRKQKLQTKQEMIKLAFDKAIAKLNSLPRESCREILSSMILNSIKTGREEVILSKEDISKLGDGFIDSINKKLLERGINGGLKISDESRNITGGFILKDGSIEINNTFEALVRMMHDELETEVVKVLFSTLK